MLRAEALHPFYQARSKFDLTIRMIARPRNGELKRIVCCSACRALASLIEGLSGKALFEVHPNRIEKHGVEIGVLAQPLEARDAVKDVLYPHARNVLVLDLDQLAFADIEQCGFVVVQEVIGKETEHYDVRMI